jgi:hypothetical protein
MVRVSATGASDGVEQAIESGESTAEFGMAYLFLGPQNSPAHGPRVTHGNLKIWTGSVARKILLRHVRENDSEYRALPRFIA